MILNKLLATVDTFYWVNKSLTHTSLTSRFLSIMSRKDQPRIKLSNEGWCEDIPNQLVKILRWNGSFGFWMWATQPLWSKYCKCCKDEEQYERGKKRVVRDHSSKKYVYGTSQAQSDSCNFLVVWRTLSLICAVICYAQSGGIFHLFRRYLRNSMSQSYIHSPIFLSRCSGS